MATKGLVLQRAELSDQSFEPYVWLGLTGPLPMIVGCGLIEGGDVEVALGDGDRIGATARQAPAMTRAVRTLRLLPQAVLDAAEPDLRERLIQERRANIDWLFETGVTWAQIGRILGMTARQARRLS